MSTPEKPKILVVNDDAAALLALTSLLAQWADEANYSIVAARSGPEALREVLRHDFAVILLDVNMPGMDGFDTAEAVHQRARSADVPIIFVTAFVADELDRLRAYRQGAVDFLFTPVIPQMLRAKVSAFTTLSQRNAELFHSNQRLMREIAERKAAERQNNAKDEFLAMLGHELRNPLSAISSAASLIRLAQDGNERVSRATSIIERQSRHLSRIVDDLLDLGRAMSGKILLNKEPLDLASVVSRSFDTFKATGRTQSHAVSLQLQAGWIEGDPTRVEQIASNLIDNALKYTAAGGTISISTCVEGDEMLLTVQDSGVGIPPDLLPHVFDVFVQGAITLDRAQGGLGIGLALVRRLVELHEGSIHAHSAGTGSGSVFSVHFPRCTPTLETSTAKPPSQAKSKPTILLIEDNDDGREMMASMLSACGYTICHAADGMRGMQLAADFRPDVALVDIGLPGVDGYEVARRLRANKGTEGIRLIALTGYGLAADQRRVFDAGFDLHLVKPVDIQHLIDALALE